MTTINPVSMSTPIKSMQFNQMLPPPPDSSDSHHISNNSSNNNNIHLNSNDINNKIKQLNNSFVPSPNKMSHHVPIAAKPIAANAHHPLLAAKPASTSVNTNNPTANKNTSSQKSNSKNQQQQQQTLASQQKQQQQQTQHQFQQQIQQFQQMQQQQQQRGVFLNGNLNIGSLFSKNNIASNQQMSQQQQLMIAEALKQQCLKNPQLAPAVNNQIQLNNQQIYQLLASQNSSNANLLQQQSQQILNKLTNLTNQQQQIDQSKIASNSSAATAAASSSVPQSATIISATTTSDGQIIFQTVPASNTAAALAAIQQQNTNSNNNNNNNNAFLQQNAQLYLNQLLNQQQQQSHSQTTPSNIVPKVADCNLQQELQLKQKLLFEEQKFRNLQLQIEQQKSQQNNNKHSPPPTAASARLSPKTNQDNRNDLNQSINSLNKQKNNESPNYKDYNNERRSMSPQDNETSNDNDLTNENENENCQEGPDIIITSNEINKIIPIASNPIHTTNATNNNNIMKPNYPIKSNSCNKRRGRPRLYAVNPMTGKSMKGRLLSNSPNSYSLTNPKSSKNPKLFPNTSVNSASNFNQIILNSNATLIPIPIHVQSNGISLYAAAAAAAAANSNNNNLIPTPSLFFSNPNNNNSNNNSNNFPDSNQNNNQQNLQFENENGHGSVTDENPENDHDYSMNETNSYHETEAPVIEQQQQINVESNNNQTSCLNNNNNSEKQLSPITEISNSIKKIKPYRLSPKTMKSQVTLTHVIDGYVIKESSKPFPVKPVKTDLYVDQSNLETINNEHEQSTNKLYDTEIKCILCGNENDNEIINGKHSSSFCKSCNRNKEQSLTNSKNISFENNKEETSNNNNNNTSNLNSSSTSVKQNRKKNKSLQEKLNTLSQNLPSPLPQSAVVSETLPIQSSTSVSPKKVQSVSTQPLFNISNNLSFTNIEQQYPSGDPTEWSCDDVFQFVKCVSGIHVAELFKAQEVDGSALSLIRDDHLVNTMQIKLGPALKIMSRFNDLKSKYNTVK